MKRRKCEFRGTSIALIQDEDYCAFVEMPLHLLLDKQWLAAHVHLHPEERLGFALSALARQVEFIEGAVASFLADLESWNGNSIQEIEDSGIPEAFLNDPAFDVTFLRDFVHFLQSVGICSVFVIE